MWHWRAWLSYAAAPWLLGIAARAPVKTLSLTLPLHENKPAFTRGELLAMIAITSILAAIFFRHRAKEVCPFLVSF
jgi:hypothetical protein